VHIALAALIWAVVTLADSLDMPQARLKLPIVGDGPALAEQGNAPIRSLGRWPDSRTPRHRAGWLVTLA
jgi:hypothetical protein